MITPDEAMKKLLEKGMEMAQIMNQADRAGYRPEISFDYRPGMTALLTITRCWHCKVTINGVSNEADPEYPQRR